MDYQNQYALIKAIRDCSSNILKEIDSIEAKTDEEWCKKADEIHEHYYDELKIYLKEIETGLEEIFI